MKVQQWIDEHVQRMAEVSPAQTVFEALQRMEAADVHCAVVRRRDGTLAGIVSERDCLRRCLLKGRDPRRTRVGTIMTRKLITASPSATLDGCMKKMLRHHIRHLPIVRRGRPLAVVTMRDLARFCLSEKDFLIKSYEDYISSG